MIDKTNKMTMHYYLKDHKGNVRVVADQSGKVEQVNHYYPFGGLMGMSTGSSVQPYKYNGKELDRFLGWDMLDYGARWYDSKLQCWSTPDPLAEKYYHLSPYVYCADNPVKYVDLRGDSISLDLQAINAIYNGLEEGTQITMTFHNGVLDPSSIADVAKTSSDVFLQDLYEIATNPQMVDVCIADESIINKEGVVVREAFNVPYDDDDTGLFDPSLVPEGEYGKHIQGNLGQSLFPVDGLPSGKRSTNGNVQVYINSKGSLNHRTVGLSHEFGHVVLFLRGLPFSHGMAGVDDFVYSRSKAVSKRLGYDY